VRDPYKGEVKSTKENETSSTFTQKLTWKVDNQTAYTAFKTKDKSGATLGTYIRYKVKEGATGYKYKYIYIHFQWTPSAINTQPETKFADKSKIKMYWYAQNGSEAGKGYVDIHGNVEAVGNPTDETVMTDLMGKLKSGAADDEYKFDIKSTLVGNKLAVDPFEDPYKSLYGGVADAKVYFVNGDETAGSTNDKLYKNADGTAVHTVPYTATNNKQIAYTGEMKTDKFPNADIDASDKTTNWYNSTEVARIDPATGVVELVPTRVAKELLNKVGHDDLVNTLTARVQVMASVCGKADQLDAIPVKLTEGESFNVKFLRPVSITNASAEFEDAETNGSEHNVSMTFVDWRNHKFVGDTRTKKENYFMYYGIRKIEVDEANAVSDINGDAYEIKDGVITKGKKLSEITSFVHFEYIKPTYATRNKYLNDGIKIIKTGTDKDGYVTVADGAFGTLTYYNNNNTVGGYHVIFPAKVYYDWGIINTTIDCYVKKTQENARRR